MSNREIADLTQAMIASGIVADLAIHFETESRQALVRRRRRQSFSHPGAHGLCSGSCGSHVRFCRRLRVPHFAHEPKAMPLSNRPISSRNGIIRDDHPHHKHHASASPPEPQPPHTAQDVRSWSPDSPVEPWTNLRAFPVFKYQYAAQRIHRRSESRWRCLCCHNFRICSRTQYEITHVGCLITRLDTFSG